MPLRPALGGPGGRGTRSPRCGRGRRPRGDPRSGLSLGSGDGAAGGWGPVFNSVPFSPWEKPGARCVTRASVRGGCGTPEPGFWVLGWLWDPQTSIPRAGLAVGPPSRRSGCWAGFGTPQPSFLGTGLAVGPPQPSDRSPINRSFRMFLARIPNEQLSGRPFAVRVQLCVAGRGARMQD